MSAHPAVSVVVPTRDRCAQLSACLAALEAQTAPSFEVVVVDDGSRNPASVARVVAAAPHARLVAGQGRGPAAARNLGARAAAAPAVAFTDDDCRPAPGWLEALTAPLCAGAAAAAGDTRNGRPDDLFAAASQAVVNHLTESSLDPATGRLGFAPTCNLACRAEVLVAVPFDESFPLAAGEDRDWCERLADRGASPLYVPGAVVAHHQQLGAAGFWRQQVRYGRGSYRWHRKGARPGRRQPAGFYAGLLARGWSHGPRAAALVLVSQLATAVGMAAEATSRR